MGPPLSVPVADVMVYPAGLRPHVAKVVSCWSVAEPLNMTLLNRCGPSGQALRSCTSTVSAVESVPSPPPVARGRGGVDVLPGAGNAAGEADAPAPRHRAGGTCHLTARVEHPRRDRNRRASPCQPTCHAPAPDRSPATARRLSPRPERGRVLRAGRGCRVPDQTLSTSPSGMRRGPVTRTSPSTTTPAPKVTSPSTSSRRQRRSEGAPAGNRCSKSGRSL
jgi:hypothetical protein